jgi:hypothetical protein
VNDGAITSMLFGDDTAFPDRARCVYRMDVIEFNGTRTPQVMVGHRKLAGP